MGANVNKYGLKRNIDPELINQLRSEVNYVCPARDEDGPCQDIFLTWHHFDPPFKDCREHRLEGIIALCSKHHIRADANEYSMNQLKMWKKNPNIKDFSKIKTKVSFLNRDDLHVNIANTFLLKNRANITCQGGAYIRIQPDDKGIITFNLKVTDYNGQDLFYLKNNIFSPASQNAIVEAKPRSLRISVKGEKTDFDIFGRRISKQDYQSELKKLAHEYVQRIQKAHNQWLRSNPYIKKNHTFNHEALMPSPSINDVMCRIEKNIKPDSLIVFLKGKIYFLGGYADFDNAFKSADGSVIIVGPFANPNVEIGSNFIAMS